MPLDILQQLEEQTRSLDDERLSAAFDSVRKKIGRSSEALSVLGSIVDAVSGSSDTLHGRLTRIAKDFETYDRIVRRTRDGSQDLSESWKRLGAEGRGGIQAMNSGLSANISLLRSAQTEVGRYRRSFGRSTPSPVTAVPSPQTFTYGGRIRGTKRFGDKNLVRVNAGEWVLTERQMLNLARIVGGRTPTEVFRMAGGNPHRRRIDATGMPMFAQGGSISAAHDSLSQMAGDAERHLASLYQSSYTAKERRQLTDNIEMIRSLKEIINRFTKEEIGKFQDIQNRAFHSYQDMLHDDEYGLNRASYSRNLDKVVQEAFETAERLDASRGLEAIDTTSVKRKGKNTESFIQEYNYNLRQMQSTRPRRSYDELMARHTAMKPLVEIAMRQDLDEKERRQLGHLQGRILRTGYAAHRSGNDSEFRKALREAREWAEQFKTLREALPINDFRDLSDDARKLAMTIRRCDEIVKSQSSGEAEKENARREGNAAKSMLDLTELRYLTRAQKRQCTDLMNRYRNASSIEEKERIVQESRTGELSLNEMQRSVGAADTALIHFNKDTDAMLESWKAFLQGTPTGMMAVGAAIAFVGKQLGDFMNGIGGSVENLAKLDIAAHNLRTNLDSMAGGGVFDELRDGLDLTREDMVRLGDHIRSAFRNAGVEMQTILKTAENIKNSFGALDYQQLQNALEIMGELTAGQQNFLLTGSGSVADMENMYANLMAGGRSGAAADLIEQGVFGGGDAENAGLNKGDRAIVDALQDMRVLGENISMTLKDSFDIVLPTLLKFGRGIGTLIPIGASVYQAAVTAHAVSKLLNRVLIPPFPVRPVTPGSSRRAGAVPAAGGTGGMELMGAMALSALASYAVNSAVSGLAARSQERTERAGRDAEAGNGRIYRSTGFVAGDTSMEYDPAKHSVSGWKYARSGGTFGSMIGGISGLLLGHGNPYAAIAGAGGGAALGSAIGYAVGEYADREEHRKNTANNPLLWRSESSLEESGVKAQLADENRRRLQLLAYGYGGASAGVSSEDDSARKLDRELISIVERTDRRIAEIRKIQEDSSGEMAASLRFQEQIERFLKKIDSGAYARFDEMNIAGARAANTLITTMGGADAGYGANVGRILESAGTAFRTNTEEISRQRMRLFKQEEMNYAVRINASNKLTEEQARISRKWLDEILSTVGEYDKIPTVIQNSLKKKISEISLAGADRGLGLTSGMSLGEAAAVSRRVADSAAAATRQFLDERAMSDSQLETVRQTARNARERYRILQSGGGSSLRSDIYDAEGNINLTALRDSQSALNRRREDLERRIRESTGLDPKTYESTVGAAEVLKSDQEEYKKILDEIEKMSEDDFAAGRSGLLDRVTKALRTSLEHHQAAAAKDDIDPKFREDLKKAIPVLQERKDRLFDDLRESAAKGGGFDKGQLKTLMHFLSKASGYAPAGIESILGAARSSPELREAYRQIGRDQSVLSESSAAHDSSTAALQVRNKSISGYLAQVEEIRSASMMLSDRVSQDPSAKFWELAQSAMESAKDSMLETGRYGAYATAAVRNASEEMNALKKAAADGRKELSGQRREILKSVRQTVGNDADARRFLSMSEQLSSARLEYAANPSSEKAAEIKRLERDVDGFVRSVSAGNADKGFKDKMIALVSMLTVSDQTAVELQKKSNEAAGRSMQLFRNMLSLLSGYREQLEYMRTASYGRESDAGMAYARKFLSADAATRHADLGVSSAKEQYGIALRSIEETYAGGMKELDRRAESARSPEELRAIGRQRDTLSSEVRTMKMEQRVQLEERIAGLAQAEYEAKKRTSDLALEALDVQSGFLQSIGAPMESIVANERRRVAYTKEQAVYAREAYERVLKSGSSEEEISKARNEWMRRDLEAVQAQYGAQRSMMEKVFGSMIGSFGETAGIQGPGNLAGKYGFGYYQNREGTVMRGGKSSGGYSDRVFGNSMFQTESVPLFSGDIPESGAERQSAISPASDRGQAGKSSSADGEWFTLGEEFKTETDALETAVFWEKKIYNLLNETLGLPAPMIGDEVSGLSPSPQTPVSGGTPEQPTPPWYPSGIGAAPSASAPLSAPVSEPFHEPVSTLRDTSAPVTTKDDTATPSKITVEVQVKFNNTMFEEAVKRVVTSPGTAKQVARGGMESQNV